MLIVYIIYIFWWGMCEMIENPCHRPFPVTALTIHQAVAQAVHPASFHKAPRPKWGARHLWSWAYESRDQKFYGFEYTMKPKPKTKSKLCVHPSNEGLRGCNIVCHLCPSQLWITSMACCGLFPFQRCGRTGPGGDSRSMPWFAALAGSQLIALHIQSLV